MKSYDDHSDYNLFWGRPECMYQIDIPHAHLLKHFTHDKKKSH